jgi:hypothetical protein
MSTAQIDYVPSRTTEARPAPPTRFFHSLVFWTIVAVAVGISWRTVRLLLQFPIWGDESFVCVNLLEKSYAEMIGPLRMGQLCPVPFLWSELAMYHLFGPSELVLRLLPYLAGLASLALFWSLCRRVFPPLPAALALALLSVSYYPVRHAVEVKPYALDLLASLCLLLPAVLYVLNPERLRWLVFLALFVPLAVVSSYPAVLIAGSISLVLLPIMRRQSWPARGWFVAYNLLLVAAFLGNYLVVGKAQLSPHEANPNGALASTFQEWFPDPDPVSLMLWFLKAHTGNMLAYPIGGPNFASSLSTVLCLAGAWSWWRGGDRRILALLAWPFVLSMAAAIVHKYPYGSSARLDQHLAPAICLLMGNGIAFLIQRCAPTAPAAGKAGMWAAGLLAAFGVAGTIRDIVKPFKTTAELWNRNFVEDLMARAGPSDRVVIFHAPNEVRPGLEWYFHRYGDRIDWRGAIDWDRLQASPGKLWCVEIQSGTSKPETIPDAIARGGLSPIPIEHYQSIAPPEHGDDPETAEVYCFGPQVR